MQLAAASLWEKGGSRSWEGGFRQSCPWTLLVGGKGTVREGWGPPGPEDVAGSSPSSGAGRGGYKASPQDAGNSHLGTQLLEGWNWGHTHFSDPLGGTSLPPGSFLCCVAPSTLPDAPQWTVTAHPNTPRCPPDGSSCGKREGGSVCSVDAAPRPLCEPVSTAFPTFSFCSKPFVTMCCFPEATHAHRRPVEGCLVMPLPPPGLPRQPGPHPAFLPAPVLVPCRVTSGAGEPGWGN